MFSILRFETLQTDSPGPWTIDEAGIPYSPFMCDYTKNAKKSQEKNASREIF